MPRQYDPPVAYRGGAPVAPPVVQTVPDPNAPPIAIGAPQRAAAPPPSFVQHYLQSLATRAMMQRLLQQGGGGVPGSSALRGAGMLAPTINPSVDGGG
jgi:hypothetical protein